jgi:hypothetical protein
MGKMSKQRINANSLGSNTAHCVWNTLVDYQEALSKNTQQGHNTEYYNITAFLWNSFPSSHWQHSVPLCFSRHVMFSMWHTLEDRLAGVVQFYGHSMALICQGVISFFWDNIKNGVYVHKIRDMNHESENKGNQWDMPMRQDKKLDNNGTHAGSRMVHMSKLTHCAHTYFQQHLNKIIISWIWFHAVFKIPSLLSEHLRYAVNSV